MTKEQHIDHINAIQAKYTDQLMRYPNVVGVGVGYRQQGDTLTDELSLVVMVQDKIPVAQLAPEDVLPSELEGVRVDVQAVGSLMA
jgi:hypothetical protein